MRFCPTCDNKLYISVSSNDANDLSYYCRFCQYVDNEIGEDGVVVLNTHFHKSEKHLPYNRYTKMDPTLPRIYNMRCPNGECKTNMAAEEGKETRAEIIYIRYDEDNMKFMYLCVECDTIWKTDDRK